MFSFISTIHYSLAKRIVKHLDGKIWFDSYKNELTIYFRIPVFVDCHLQKKEEPNSFGKSVNTIVENLEYLNRKSEKQHDKRKSSNKLQTISDKEDDSSSDMEILDPKLTPTKREPWNELLSSDAKQKYVANIIQFQ